MTKPEDQEFVPSQGDDQDGQSEQQLGNPETPTEQSVEGTQSSAYADVTSPHEPATSQVPAGVFREETPSEPVEGIWGRAGEVDQDSIEDWREEDATEVLPAASDEEDFEDDADLEDQAEFDDETDSTDEDEEVEDAEPALSEAEIAIQRERLAQQKERLARQQAEIAARQEAYLAEQEAIAEQQAALERQQAQIAADRAAKAAQAEAEAAALLEEQRAERERLLGTVRTQEEGPTVVTVPGRTVRSTDKFAGAFGLLVLRIVLAAIIGIRGYQKLIDIGGTADFFKTQIPESYATYAAWGVGIAEVVCAAFLLVGLGTRYAAGLVAAIGVAFITLFYWGAFNPFEGYSQGFSGEFQLLVVAAALTLCFLGSGRIGIDANYRLGKERAKEEASIE